MEGHNCCFFSLPGYRYLGDGGTDRRKMSVRIGLGQICPFGAVPPVSPNTKFWALDRECLENGKLQRYMSPSARRVFSKNVSHGQ